MAKKFKGFNNQQTHQLLKEMGFTGPAQKDEMDAFIASSPSAGSMLGRYTDIARQRVEGGPLAQTGMAEGGEVDYSTYYDDQGNLRNLELDKVQTNPALGNTEALGSAQQDILKMSQGKLAADLQYDTNKDGVITAADAVGYTEQTQQQAQQQQQALVEEQLRGRQSEIDALNARLRELQGLPKNVNITQPISSYQQTPITKMPIDEEVPMETTQADLGNVKQKEGAVIGLPGSEELIELPIVQPPEDTAGTKTIAEGSADKGPTQAATNLDTAQQEYATAQQTLVDAQLAVSSLVEPEAKPFESEEDLTSIATTYLDPATVRQKYGFTLSNDEKSNTPISQVKSMLESGKMPTDPTKYGENEPTGSPDNWKFTYDNGQTITIRRNNKQNAIADFANLAKLFTDFKDSELFKGNKTPEQIDYDEKQKAVVDAELANTQAQSKVSTAQKQFETTDIPSTSEALGKAISDPSSLVSKQKVAGIEAQDDQFIKEGTGQVEAAERLQTKLGKAAITKEVVNNGAATYEAVLAQDTVKAALAEFAAQTGTPSEDAISKAETMTPEELAQLNLDPATADFIRDIPEIKRKIMDGELPEGFAAFDEYVKVRGAQFEGEVEEAEVIAFKDRTPTATAQVNYNLPPTEIAQAEATKVQQAAQFPEYATAQEKQSAFVPNFTGEERDVTDKEIIDVNKIINSPEILAVGETIEALTGDAVAKAASTTFTQALEAKAITGTVSANSTVAGQLEKLMSSFDDGTPAWAAGALRSVNATMLARGLGGSSMAAAAMVQAAMETTLPIAQADASIFQAMDMENVRNAQAVSLANAAAAQNFDLANLSNRQAANLQRSLGNTNLQMQNLSNTQEAVLASAQLKASLRGQELGVKENVAIANAARYAQVNDINLTNAQQSSILRSSQSLEVDMANLSNRQQTALSNLQVKAAMMGQDLTNEQQIAVLTTTQAFESKLAEATRKQQAFIQDASSIAAMEGQSLSNSQQTQLFNVGNVVAERGINLNNEQQTTLFNSTNKMTMDVENLSNRQQAVLAEAQIEAAMKGQELTNDQQNRIIRTERIAEIANQQFSADTARVMRTSELANSVDLSVLSNAQAKIMSDAAAMTQVDITNLNNRQQAAQQKAAAFLEMDFVNLSNEQQMVMFKAQSTTQSILSDQAAENAAAQFNAESINQTNQFYDNLNAQIDIQNTAQQNAMEQFNIGEQNTMTKFQAELDNQRDLFNAQNEMVVAQANTKWRQDIATTNTAALNEANMTEVMAQNNLTTQGIAELWQQERDLMDFAWTSSEKQMDRDHELAKAKIQADADEDSAYSSAAGNFLSSVVTSFVSKTP